MGRAEKQCGRDLAKCCHLIGVEIYLWPAPQAKEAYSLSIQVIFHYANRRKLTIFQEIVEPLGPTKFNNVYSNIFHWLRWLDSLIVNMSNMYNII